MSKKQLNEVRRFMKLANLNGNITSNFIKETYGAGYMHEEEEIDAEEEFGIEEPVGDEGLEIEDEFEDVGLEDEMGPPVAGIEGGGDAEELVLNIVNDIQQLASLAGVDVDVEGDEAVEDDVDMDIDMEMGPDDEMDIEGDIELDTEEPAEETLEEMINAILAEEESEEESDKKKKPKEGEVGFDEEAWFDGESAADIKKKKPEEGEVGFDEEAWFDGKSAADIELAALQTRAKKDKPEDKGRTKPHRLAKRPPRGRTPLKGVAPQNESVQILDDEKLIQEVTKRVKKRLAKYARAKNANDANDDSIIYKAIPRQCGVHRPRYLCIWSSKC